MIDIINAIREIATKIQNLAAPQYDGVYVDSMNGVAGTGAGIGTPQNPSSNLTDALAIATARKLRKFYLVNPQDTFTAPTDFEFYEFVGTGAIDQAINSELNPNGFSFAGSVFRGVTFPSGSQMLANATPAIFHDCFLSMTLTGYGSFYNCRIFDFNPAKGIISSYFLMQHCVFPINDYVIITPQTTGVKLDLQECSGLIEIDAVQASSYISVTSGDGLQLIIDVSCNAGEIDIWGDVKITDNHVAPCVVNDYTNKPQAEKAINITAIAASPTNFLNLSTSGFHYTVDDLVLKCADPGVNTVNVVLSKLVNGVLTAVHTFAIVTGAVALTRGVTGGFGIYFGLDDMFTREQLAGDNLLITVQATGGGPYAVTGSYVVRSA